MIYSVSTQLYREVADRLMEAIGDKGYFSGAVELNSEDAVACRLVTSCVVWRTSSGMPEGEGSRVRSVVPVWWEFHTACAAGVLDNDFSFGELGLENLVQPWQ